MQTEAKTEGQILLENLEQADLRVLERRFALGETIFAPGDPVDRIHFLIAGDLRVYKLYGPYREATTAVLRDGGIFGNSDMISSGSQENYAETLAEARVGSVSKSDIRYRMEQRPHLAGTLFSALAQQVRRGDECIYHLLPREVTPRLAVLLLSLVERFGDEDDEEGTVIEFRLTHQQLADMIACTREAVSKVMSEFQRNDLIQVYSHKVRVLDQAGLRAKRAVTAHNRRTSPAAG